MEIRYSLLTLAPIPDSNLYTSEIATVFFSFFFFNSRCYGATSKLTTKMHGLGLGGVANPSANDSVCIMKNVKLTRKEEPMV